MKILQTVQSVISKIEKKEASQFREYAIYKKEKKLLRLFEVLYKHDKTVELEYLQIYLKEKNVHQNLRNSCKKLYELFLCFWKDNPPEIDKNIEISKLMHGASILVKRGLIEEGLALYEKAKDLAETGEKYSYQYEILRMSMHWRNLLYPKKAIQVLEQAEVEAETIGKKMQTNLAVNILAAKVHFAILNCNNWAFTKKDELFFHEASEKAKRLVNMDSCALRSKFVCNFILAQIANSNPNSGKAQYEFHTLSCIQIAESLYTEDPKKFGPLLIYKIVGLLYLYFAGKEFAEFNKQYQRLEQYLSVFMVKDRNLEAVHYEAELLNCLLNHDYSSAENVVIPATLNFLKKNSEKIPYRNNWDLHAMCLEVKLSVGKLEEAEWYLQQMTQEDKQASLPYLHKYITRLFVLLYNFELGNFEYVDNAARSTRRLYADLLKGNPGGKLFLSYLIKLSNVSNHSSRIPIFQSFKIDLEEVFENYYYQKIISVNILADWIDAKINQADTIQQFVTSDKFKQQT